MHGGLNVYFLDIYIERAGNLDKRQFETIWPNWLEAAYLALTGPIGRCYGEAHRPKGVRPNKGT